MINHVYMCHCLQGVSAKNTKEKKNTNEKLTAPKSKIILNNMHKPVPQNNSDQLF